MGVLSSNKTFPEYVDVGTSVVGPYCLGFPVRGVRI